MREVFTLFCILSVFLSVRSWSLSSLNIISSEASVIHVSVYYGRAFLCIEHKSNSVHSSLPTLVEASWPENVIGVKPKAFPSEASHLRRAGKCKGVKQAHSTDVDVNGRLWMIDSGNEACSAKIIIYDLLYFNDEVKHVLKSSIDLTLTSIIKFRFTSKHLVD